MNGLRREKLRRTPAPRCFNNNDGALFLETDALERPGKAVVAARIFVNNPSGLP